MTLSEKNPLLKDVRRATGRGTLTEDGYAITEGFHLLEDALASKLELGAVIVAERAWEQIAQRFPRLAAPRIEKVTDSVFQGLASTEHPQGVMALVRPPQSSIQEVFRGAALAVVLDGVQDPGNAGAILRAAEAFGSTGAVFLKGSVNPYNPKCLRGSAGSIFRLPVISGITEEALLEAAKVAIYAAMPRAVLLASQADFAQPCAIVIGGEGAGVRVQGVTAVSIPTVQVESLNAAVAAGVLLYEARSQRMRKGTLA